MMCLIKGIFLDFAKLLFHSIERRGRERAVELEAIPPLTKLCLDEDDSVKAKALAALMM